MALAKNNVLTEENDDSFLTCLNACATITTLSGLPAKEANAHFTEVVDALAKIWNVRLDDIPEDLVVPYFKLRATVAEAIGYKYENYGSGTWHKV
jgi:hypothetical protein